MKAVHISLAELAERVDAQPRKKVTCYLNSARPARQVIDLLCFRAVLC